MGISIKLANLVYFKIILLIKIVIYLIVEKDKTTPTIPIAICSNMYTKKISLFFAPSIDKIADCFLFNINDENDRKETRAIEHPIEIKIKNMKPLESEEDKSSKELTIV